MKRDRNQGMMPYPIYPPYQGINPNMMPMPVPIGMDNNMSCGNNSTQSTNSLQEQINSLEKRVSVLENNNYNGKYNTSNYQVM